MDYLHEFHSLRDEMKLHDHVHPLPVLNFYRVQLSFLEHARLRLLLVVLYLNVFLLMFLKENHEENGYFQYYHSMASCSLASPPAQQPAPRRSRPSPRSPLPRCSHAHPLSSSAPCFRSSAPSPYPSLGSPWPTLSPSSVRNVLWCSCSSSMISRNISAVSSSPSASARVMTSR